MVVVGEMSTMQSSAALPSWVWPVIGASIAVCLALLLVVLILVFRRRRRQQRAPPTTAAVVPAAAVSADAQQGLAPIAQISSEYASFANDVSMLSTSRLGESFTEYNRVSLASSPASASMAYERLPAAQSLYEATDAVFN
jgi:hypothetical protein